MLGIVNIPQIHLFSNVKIVFRGMLQSVVIHPEWVIMRRRLFFLYLNYIQFVIGIRCFFLLLHQGGKYS